MTAGSPQNWRSAPQCGHNAQVLSRCRRMWTCRLLTLTSLPERLFVLASMETGPER